ncbi:MAG: bifunctional adenosylcobinamide kinase/adenosylcobinamide-phosphate guanylyltransferase [Planctomycetes bacterium]|nr:bifunctional adenosylcobinamide kinase/adenosylcobinamide-phosphate guanylyltransferase [Planctomycetota bacterium]
MARLTLVLGGVRSGKSRFAEQLAAAWPPVAYLATAQAGDEEMTRRIAQHRQRRDPSWSTVEEPWELGPAIERLIGPEAHPRAGCVVVECLSLWLTNLLVGVPGWPAQEDAAIRAAVNALARTLEMGTGRVIVVSNEVGWGIVPANALARRFADLLGETNQRLAAAAREVHGLVAGIPLRFK